jgi:hypothetical protein
MSQFLCDQTLNDYLSSHQKIKPPLREAAQEELIHRFNYMTDSKNVKVLTKDSFPKELNGCKAWLNWKSLPSGAKSPINAWGKATGYNDETIWVSLDDAIKRANAENEVQVGISLTPDGLKINDSYLWCFDFDGFSADEGDDEGTVEFARKVLTYTEFSPSGTGLKMFFLSDKVPSNHPKILFTPSKFASVYPNVKKYQERALEVFSKGRFLAMTGDWYSSKTELPLKYIPEAQLDALLIELDQWAKREGGVGIGTASTQTNGNKVNVNAAHTANGNTEYGKLTEASLKAVLARIDHHDEQVWSDVSNALARAYGESGRGYFIQWSEDGFGQGEYAGFSEDEVNNRYDRALSEVAGRGGFGCRNLCLLGGVAPENQVWEIQISAEQEAAFGKLFESLSSDASSASESHQIALDATTNDIVELFNKEHFAAMEGGSLWVFKEAFDAELEVNKLDRYKPASFKDLHNQSVLIDGKSKRIGDYWFNHPQRRTYLNGFAFIPKGNCPNSTYNLWRGFGVESMQGDVKPILDYVKEVLCKNDETNYAYFINWLAYGVQNPDRQGEVAVVMRGLKGTGKSTLGRLMVKIYGRHGMQVTNSKHLVGNFNAHLQGKVFLFADEAFFAGNRQDEDVLKGLVTEQNVTIEKKGVDAVTGRNRLQILMSSNHEWVVPASSDERRYFILDVSEERIGDKPYWEQLNRCVSDGGTEALLHYLQSLDITKFDVRTVPNTIGLDMQKMQGLDAVQSVVFQWLSIGKVNGWEWKSEEGIEVSTEEIFNAIKNFCKDSPRHRYGTPPIETIGRQLKRLIGAVKGRKRDGKDLTNVYKFPSLNDARASFTAHMKLTNNIWIEEDLVDQREKNNAPLELDYVD